MVPRFFPVCLLAALAVLTAPAAFAQKPAAALPYTIEDAFIRETPMKMSAGYIVLHNATNQADALVSASADWADRIELHEVKADAHEVMHMQKIDSMPLPAKGELSLRPGSYHLMIFGVKNTLKPDEKKTITLTFEKAGAFRIPFTVQPIAYQGQQAEMDHGPMHHDVPQKASNFGNEMKQMYRK